MPERLLDLRPSPCSPPGSRLPVYAWQGLGVRRRTSRLLPAAGPATGAIDGAEPAFSLLVLGDSSAASVGIEQIGERARRTACRADRRKHRRAVRWRAAGFNSATSGQIRDHVVPNLAADPWTHIVLAVGTNDIKNFHSLPRFKKEFGGLLYALARQMAGSPHRLAAGHRDDRRAGAAAGAGQAARDSRRRDQRAGRPGSASSAAPGRRRGSPSPMRPPAFRATASTPPRPATAPGPSICCRSCSAKLNLRPGSRRG